MTNAPDTLMTNLRKLGLVAFSMPAAIGLLDKFDSRLGLSDLLKRVVQNYEVVVAALWRAVGHILPLPPDFDFRFWTFFALVLTPVLFEILRRNYAGEHIGLGRPGFWGYASALAYLGYAIAFSTGGEIAAGGVEIIVVLVVFVPVMTIGFFLLVAVAPVDWEERENTKTLAGTHKQKPSATGGVAVLRWLACAGIVVGVFFVSDLLTTPVANFFYDLFSASDHGGIRGLAVGLSVMLMLVFLFGNLRSPAYVFFWFFGILAIDYAATDIVPGVNAWLDGLEV